MKTKKNELYFVKWFTGVFHHTKHFTRERDMQFHCDQLEQLGIYDYEVINDSW